MTVKIETRISSHPSAASTPRPKGSFWPAMQSTLVAHSSGVNSGISGSAGGEVSVHVLRNSYYEPLKKMRAIHVDTFGGPEVLKIKTNLIVPPLTPTQVLVRVMYTGVNPVETYIREGQYSR